MQCPLDVGGQGDADPMKGKTTEKEWDWMGRHEVGEEEWQRRRGEVGGGATKPDEIERFVSDNLLNWSIFAGKRWFSGRRVFVDQTGFLAT
ncbi:hypothetical protein RRG08_064611 [Elysia crispata]|uniref:Uncharacterized protein n=1 Tax=Elysia crispata TaxID=231223 RepID=A0AAE1BB61_9GAST|nr:hypothetical protein RRG08_064611 [Elysia crispata]